MESRVNVELRQWLLANDPPKSQNDRAQFDRQHLYVTPAGGGVRQ